MIEPKRWIDDGAPETVRDLLVAGSTEQPGDAATERTLAALGAGSALAAGSSLARGAASLPALKGTTAIGQATLALKWGLMGVVAALGAAGAAHEILQKASPAASPRAASTSIATTSDRVLHATPTSRATASPVRQGSAEAASPVPSLESELAAAPRIPRSANVPRVAIADDAVRPAEPGSTGATSPLLSTASASELLAEVAAIDAARAAVARGDATRALAALDAYAANFKSHRFDPEALYLRMEALGHAGDLEGQRRVAQQLLSRFPSAPQTARARAVLDANR